MLFRSCSEQIDENLRETESGYLSRTRSIDQQIFDWENADFMPTPEGITPIPTPWIGQGSLIGTYGLDILNDRKESEGWVLLYNSFTTNPNHFSQSPYFILYNKYRGIMRIFYYVTGSFIQTSSNIIDNLSIASEVHVNMFCFADNEIINGDDNRSSLQHIQPKPFDGSLPVSSYRWYMAQYELAYNPNISSIPYNQIAFNFNLNFRDISTITLDASSISKLEGTIGEQSTGEISKAFNKAITEGGKATLSNISYSLLKKSVDSEGKNSFGINPKTYSSILKNIGNVASSSIGGVWGAAAGLLNTMLFGTKTSPTPIYATINTKLSAEGTISQDGSFPNMPINFYMPGTNIPSSAPGLHPLYNKPLGIFCIDNEELYINIAYTKVERNRYDDPYNPGAKITECWEEISCEQPRDYSLFLKFNPEVEKIANIKIIKQQIFAIDKKDGTIYDNRSFNVYNSGESSVIIDNLPDVTFYLYFAIEIEPKDGSSSTIISKAFNLRNIIRRNESWLPDLY